MAVKTLQFSISGTAITPLTLSDTDSTTGCTVWVYNESHGNHTLAIGGSDVTYANGMHVYGGEKFGPIRLTHGELLYATTTANETIDVHLLITQG